MHLHLLISFLLVFSCVCAPAAAMAERLVRVGYDNLPSYMERDNRGNLRGYQMEYLQEIAALAGWKLEFTEASLEVNLRKLAQGEIDLLGALQRTPEREQHFLFSEYPMGETVCNLYVARGNENINFNDFKAFNGMHIAVMRNSRHNASLASFAARNGFSYETLPFSHTTEALDAVHAGKADAAAVGSLIGVKRCRLVASFGAEPFYLAAPKDRQELMRELVDAQEKLRLLNPAFLRQLQEKYYGQRIRSEYIPFTREEKEYIRNSRVLSAGMLPHSAPLSVYNADNGKMEGIYADMMQLIAQKSGLRFALSPLPGEKPPLTELKDKHQDLVVGVAKGREGQQDSMLTLSAPLFSLPLVAAVRHGTTFSAASTLRAAVKHSYPQMEAYLRATYPSFTILRYASDEACLDAVENNEADIVIQKAPLLQHLLQNPRHAGLTLLPSFGDSEFPCIALPVKNNELLLSILNKTLAAITPAEISNIQTTQTIRSQYQISLTDMLYQHRITLGVAALLLLALLLCALLLSRQRLRHYALLEEQNRQLADAIEQAEQASRAKGEFLSRMSHEIRTPLNAVIGMATIASGNMEDRVQVNRCLAQISQSARMLLGLLNDILDMSAIESKKMQIAHTPFDFKQVISSITSVYYGQCRQKNIRFDVMFSDVNEETLIGDQLRLNQILLNLISNALKFTPKGGSIRLGVQQREISADRISLRFSVSDTGKGMSPAFMNRIFKPFEQQDASTARQHGGSGLGLSIAKRLAEMMGGSIQVESEEGKGSVFHVELPFDLPAKTENTALLKHNLPGLRALIVDDDSVSGQYTSIVLRRMGIAHDFVSSGEEALRKFEEAQAAGHGYDICFIDWKMPGMSGISTTKALRERFDRDTTIIIVSAYDLQEIDNSAHEAGADMCIAKPLFQSTICDLLSELTGGKCVTHSADSQDFDFNGRTFLIAEDNMVNMEVASGLMRMVGARLVQATNGEEAVRLFEESAPGDFDIILMDIQMPIMDGLEATRRIRASSHPAAARIPILAMTANAFHEDIQACLSAGMNDHIAKPLDTQRLYSTIAKYIAGSPAAPVRPEEITPPTTKENTVMDKKQMLVAAGIDYDAGVRRFSGNSALFETVLKTLPRDETFAQLGPALEAKEYEQAIRLTHTIKGAAGNLSVIPLYENAVQLMAALKAGEYDRAAELYENMRTAHEQAVAAITSDATA